MNPARPIARASSEKKLSSHSHTEACLTVCVRVVSYDNNNNVEEAPLKCGCQSATA